ncbi:MAG: hypothetical protein AABW88_01625, partial [Nanoarchaeota archaeon]
MMKSKKAQLTIFIIIGIVLLFSAALITFIRQNVVLYKPPVEITETVATELQPIQRYVIECLEIVAKEGIRKAGVQGGIIDTSRITVNDLDPTSAEGISMSPGSSIKIPYWHYMKSPNSCDGNCEFASNMPALFRTSGKGNSLEEQLDKYIREKISSCTRGFSSFRKRGFTFEESQIKVTSTIAKTDVFVRAEYPLKITKDEIVQTISKFSVKIPINLAKYYELAAEVTKKEAETNFLGYFAINLIDIYSGVDKNRLPPLADTSFKRGGVISWPKNEVKNKVQELLMSNVVGMQITGTSNYEGNYYQGNDPLAKGMYSFYILPSDKTYRVNADFTYLAWWPIYLHVTPSRGELITPNSRGGFDSFISLFNINQYKFAYDVSYPVLISISDPTELDGDGFIFQFSLESNLRNNAMMTVDTVNMGSIASPRESFVCDPDNFNSGNITVIVSDSMTKDPIEDAQVFFSFGRESCYIGVTEVSSLRENNKITGDAVLKAKMPPGLGSLVVFKEGYMSKTIPFGAYLDEEQEISVELEKFVDLNVSVKLVPFVKRITGITLVEDNSMDQVDLENSVINYTWSPLGTTLPMTLPTHQAVISFSRISETADSEEYAAFADLSGSNGTAQITLPPGDYDIQATLLDNRKTIVPEGEECFDDSFWDQFGLGDQKCEIIDAVVFAKFPNGGVMLDSFSVTASKLNGAKEVVIYLILAPTGYTRDVTGVTNLVH